MYSKEIIVSLKEEFNKLVQSEPFNGKITHRNRAEFIGKWKAVLESKGISGAGYVDDLLRALK